MSKDLEGLGDALLVTPAAAATTFVCCKWSKLAAPATAAAHELCGHCVGDFAVLVEVRMLTLLVVLPGGRSPKKKMKSLRHLFSSFLQDKAVRLIAIKSMIKGFSKTKLSG